MCPIDVNYLLYCTLFDPLNWNNLKHSEIGVVLWSSAWIIPESFPLCHLARCECHGHANHCDTSGTPYRCLCTPESHTEGDNVSIKGWQNLMKRISQSVAVSIQTFLFEVAHFIFLYHKRAVSLWSVTRKREGFFKAANTHRHTHVFARIYTCNLCEDSHWVPRSLTQPSLTKCLTITPTLILT